MKNKPVVGQIIYEKPYGDRLRRHGNVGINEFVVKKVGRKYFYAGDKNGSAYDDGKYLIESWEQSSYYGSVDSILYESKKEYHDEKESYFIYLRIRKIFSGYTRPKISLSELRELWKVLGKYDKEDE